jgi:hypothetical protein
MPLAAEEKEEYRLRSMSSRGLSCLRFFVLARCIAATRLAPETVEGGALVCGPGRLTTPGRSIRQKSKL